MKSAVKGSLVVFSLMLLFLMTSCTKDQSTVDGQITYLGAVTGIEYYANEATVYLMIDDTTYAQKTVTDVEGNYSFYPVNDGSYFIYAEITVNLIDYVGVSSLFFVEKDWCQTENVIME